MDKSELKPKQVFDVVCYQFVLREGKVRQTLEAKEFQDLCSDKIVLIATPWLFAYINKEGGVDPLCAQHIPG